MAKKKNLGGRPPFVMTDVIMAKLEYAFSLSCTDAEACGYAGISKDSFYRYQRKHPKFCERKEWLKKELVFKSRAVIKEAIEVDGDIATAKWNLERKQRDEYSTKIETDNKHTGLNILVANDSAREALEDL